MQDMAAEERLEATYCRPGDSSLGCSARGNGEGRPMWRANAQCVTWASLERCFQAHVTQSRPCSMRLGLLHLSLAVSSDAQVPSSSQAQECRVTGAAHR